MKQFCVCLLLVLCAALTTNAQATRDPKSLAGFPLVSVLVEPLNAEAQSAGLDQTQLQSDAELKLREHGLFKDSSPQLKVYITVLKAPSCSYYALSISVVLRRIANFGNNGNKAYATVAAWSDGEEVLVPRSMVSAAARESIDNLLSTFMNDYLAANQRTKG